MYSPVIDERSLIPRQVNMMRRIYGICSDLDAMGTDCMLDNSIQNYKNLQNCFYNFDDKTRSFIGSNFPQVDEIINDYLVYKGLEEAPKKA